MRSDGPVMIAVDGSPNSDQTLEWGLDEALRRGADVVVARAYQEPREVTQWSWYPILDDLHFDTEAKQYLADALDRAAHTHPSLRVTTRLLHGPEVPELRALSEEAQLLVIGARGQAGHARIGRVSGHLAAHARCPVVVVRDAASESGPVVVGVDGSPTSLAAVEVAAQEAAMRGVPLDVVHARPHVLAPDGTERAAYGTPLATSDETDPTHRAAQQVAADLRERNPGLTVRVELVDDDPAHALAHVSRGASLLVVGSRGLGSFRGMLLGAVSNEVVRDAPGTVLVVHERWPDRGQAQL